MPAGLIPDEGLENTLLRVLDPARGGSASWRLIFWVNDIEPDHATVLADLVEASWGGYTFVSLDASKWTTPTISDGCASSDYDVTPLQWWVTSGPTETNYGYALIDTGAGVIRFIQRFEPDDIEPLVVGARVVLLPKYTMTSAACPESP